MYRWAYLSFVVFVVGFPSTSRPAAAADDHDLAAVLPADTLIYIGWSGADAWRETSKGTALDKLLNEPQMKRCTGTLWEQLEAFFKNKLDQEGAGVDYESLRSLLLSLWKYPGALSVLDVAFTEQGPDLQVALLIRAGDQCTTLIKDFETVLESNAMPLPVEVELEGGQKCKQLMIVPLMAPIVYTEVDDHVVMALGLHTFRKVLASLKQGPHLLDDPYFSVSRRKMAIKPRRLVKNVYLNVSGLLDRFKQIYPVVTGKGPEGAATVDAVIEAIGLDAIRSLSIANQVHGEGYRLSMFLHTQDDLDGLLSRLDQKPITDQDLRVIPSDATIASACNLDLSDLYDRALSMVKVFMQSPTNPAEEQLKQDVTKNAAEDSPHSQLQSILDQIDATLGFKLKEDFLDALGDTFVLFDSPSNGGLILTGLTLVVEAKDPEKVHAALNRFVSLIGENVQDGRVAVKSYPYGEHQISFVNVAGLPMPIAPAWSVHGHRLIFGLYPQMVVNVLDRLTATQTGRSILDNKDFQRSRSQIPPDAFAIGYVDTKQGVGNMYALILPLAQIATAMAQGAGLELDISLLPSRDVITRHLFGNVSGMYSDAEGIMWVSYGALPLPLPSLGSGSGFTTAMTVAILLPSLARAREQAKRVQSLTNLVAIGQAISMYADDHQGKLPPDLATLRDGGLIGQETLCSPMDYAERISYVYIPNQTYDDSPQNILAYERPDISDAGINVLFVDLHGEWMDHARFEKLLQDTINRLGDRYQGPKPGSGKLDGL